MPLPNLRVRREEARKRIDAKLTEGREIRNSMDSNWVNQQDLELARVKMTKWVQYVKDLLETLFYNGSVVEQFAPSSGYPELVAVPSFREEVGLFLESMDGYLHRLESIFERLDLAPEVGAKPAGLVRPTTQSSTIFISHSSEDDDVIRVVREAFEELSLTPMFNEKNPSGIPAVNTIVQRIRDSKALFAFLTFNSISGKTRDWIVFELGIAQAYDKPIHTWILDSISKEQLFPFIEQITTYQRFEILTSKGTLKLRSEVRGVAKELSHPR